MMYSYAVPKPKYSTAVDSSFDENVTSVVDQAQSPLGKKRNLIRVCLIVAHKRIHRSCPSSFFQKRRIECSVRSRTIEHYETLAAGITIWTMSSENNDGITSPTCTWCQLVIGMGLSSHCRLFGTQSFPDVQKIPLSSINSSVLTADCVEMAAQLNWITVMKYLIKVRSNWQRSPVW